MIALAPSVELLFEQRDQVHQAFLASVVTAAVMSNRVPVYPLIPCDSPWLAHKAETSRHKRSLEISHMVDRFAVQFGPTDDLQCLWKAWCCKECSKSGLQWYEFDRALQDLPLHDQYPHEGAGSAHDATA
jgi:hypothetical protein